MQRLRITGSKLNSIDGIDRFRNLTLLDFTDNLITDISLVGKLTELETLNVSNNMINKIDDKTKGVGLGNLKNLEDLNLSGNNLNIDNFVDVGTGQLKSDILNIFKTLYTSGLRSLDLTSTGLKNIKTTFQAFGSWTSLNVDS